MPIAKGLFWIHIVDSTHSMRSRFNFMDVLHMLDACGCVAFMVLMHAEYIIHFAWRMAHGQHQDSGAATP